MTPGALDTAAEVTSTADWVNVVIAIIVGVATVAVAGQQLNRRARIRTQLSAELDIWASLPRKHKSKNLMLEQAGLTADLLLELESPRGRARARSKVIFLLVMAATLPALILMRVIENAPPAVAPFAPFVIGVLLALIVIAINQWLKRRDSLKRGAVAPTRSRRGRGTDESRSTGDPVEESPERASGGARAGHPAETPRGRDTKPTAPG